MNETIDEISNRIDLLLKTEKETDQLFRNKIVEYTKNELLTAFKKQKIDALPKNVFNLAAMGFGALFRDKSYGKAILDCAMQNNYDNQSYLNESETRLNLALNHLDGMNSSQLLRLICLCYKFGFEESIRRI